VINRIPIPNKLFKFIRININDMETPKYRFKYTKKEFEKYLDEIGENLPDTDFVMQRKMHRRDIGYGLLLRSYEPIKFEKKYNEWVKSKESKHEII